jgi:pimeloyl-ACP methyl ester carboxylesterase
MQFGTPGTPGTGARISDSRSWNFHAAVSCAAGCSLLAAMLVYQALPMVECAMRTAPLLKTLAWFALACMAGTNCAEGLPTSIKPATFGELQHYLVSHKADLAQFRSRGPFPAAMLPNRELQPSPGERILADFFLSVPGDKAPLVVFVHGLGTSKEAHARQAMHLASWGMHCLTLGIPGEGEWVNKGKMLARIVQFIAQHPEAVDARIDPRRIILVGHSFGASSVAVALAEGADAAGAILLDPAGRGRDLPGYIGKIRAPVMILGADEEVFSAIRRDDFYRLIPEGVGEVSIRNATHADAQYPSRTATHMFGVQTSEELQVTFVSALTAAAVALSAERRFDYAWSAFAEDIASGALINPRKK